MIFNLELLNASLPTKNPPIPQNFNTFDDSIIELVELSNGSINWKFDVQANNVPEYKVIRCLCNFSAHRTQFSVHI